MSGIVIAGHQPPRPDPAVEARVRAELQNIDSLLDIKWVDNIVYSPIYKALEGRYACICYFPSDDPRRKLFQTGEIGSDYEILGWFAEDLQDAEVPVEPEKVWNRVLDMLASADNQRVGWKQRLRSAAEKNKKLREANKKAFLDGFVQDQFEYDRSRNLGNPIVAVPKEIK